MDTPYPKRLQTLKISEQTLAGEKVYIVSDEETGAYYQFREVEWAILHNLDGSTSLPALREKINSQFHVEISPEQLEAFVQDLAGKGLLEGAQRKKEKPDFWKNLFYLRFKTYNPDKFLEKLAVPLSPLFTKPFLVAETFLILWSLGLAYAHRTEWVEEARSMLHFWGIPTAYLALLLTVFVHEMGHAITCKHYGGQVKEMGFMLIYFQPAFYANVSDAYRFPEKRRRAFVGIAGSLFQFVFLSFVILMWYFSIPGSPFSSFLVSMIGLSIFTLFFNLNPLIKLDGYYILSDLLEVTNLRANSFQYLKLLLRRQLFPHPEVEKKIAQISPRLKKIYLWYGILGAGFTSILLYYIFRFIAVLLIRDLQTLGALLLLGGFAFAGWKWYKENRQELIGLRDNVKGSIELGSLFRTGMGKIGATIGICLLLGILIPTRWGLKGACVVKPEVKRAVAPLESGILSKVYRHAGEPLRRGEILANLDDFALQRELAMLRIKKTLKEEQLQLLKADYGSSLSNAWGNFSKAGLALETNHLLSPHKIQEARSAREASKARLEKAQTKMRIAGREWDRYQILARENLISPKEMEETEAAYAQAKEEEEQSQKEYAASTQTYLKILKQATVTDPKELHQELDVSRKNLSYVQKKSVEIEAAQSELALVKSQMETDQEKLDRMRIRSPIDGILMTPRVEELEGKKIQEGEPIAWVYQPGPMIFEVHMDELDIPEAPKQNDKRNDVTVKLLALPGHSFNGIVRRIVPESLANGKGKAYLVDVEIQDFDNILLPGMQGTGKIYGHWRPFLWQLFRRPVKYVAWKLWSIF